MVLSFGSDKRLFNHIKILPNGLTNFHKEQEKGEIYLTIAFFEDNEGKIPIDLDLNFEILKKQVRRSRFFVYFGLDFYCKNPVQNR